MNEHTYEKIKSLSDRMSKYARFMLIDEDAIPFSMNAIINAYDDLGKEIDVLRKQKNDQENIYPQS